MTNLAIECSGTAGSVALFDGNEQLKYLELDPTIGSVQTLAAAIQTLLSGFAKPHIISVTHGPGSFTGLRVGLATAKMLALAWRIPVIPVDTLQAVALRAFRHAVEQPESPFAAENAIFVPVINAFRKQVFTAAVAFSPDLRLLAESRVLDAAAWQASPLTSQSTANSTSTLPIVLCGPGLRTFPVTLAETSRLYLAPEAIWNPTAWEVACLGAKLEQRGTACDAFTLQPLYLRASAAEEQAKL